MDIQELLYFVYMDEAERQRKENKEKLTENKAAMENEEEPQQGKNFFEKF